MKSFQHVGILWLWLFFIINSELSVELHLGHTGLLKGNIELYRASYWKPRVMYGMHIGHLELHRTHRNT